MRDIGTRNKGLPMFSFKKGQVNGRSRINSTTSKHYGCDTDNHLVSKQVNVDVLVVQTKSHGKT